MMKDVQMTVPKSRETSIRESVDSLCRDGADTPIKL